MHRILLTLLLATLSLNAHALSILISGDKPERDVTARLEGLGHTLTQSNAAWWGSTWDYSAYDVVVLQYATNEVADTANLLSAVQAGETGVVFFRAWGAHDTAYDLGMTSDNNVDNMHWQAAGNNFDIVDNSHYITKGWDLGQHDLGFNYMTQLLNPGANTTTLANGADGAALVVHNSLRMAVAPFYGHENGYNDETAFGIELTERTLKWAAGADVVPIPAAAWLFGSALFGLGWMRHAPLGERARGTRARLKSPGSRRVSAPGQGAPLLWIMSAFY